MEIVTALDFHQKTEDEDDENSSSPNISLCFILSVVLGLRTRTKETINFVHFLYKTIITNTPNHVSTNRKIDYWIKLINFALKIENDTYFVAKKILYNDTYSETEGVMKKTSYTSQIESRK